MIVVPARAALTGHAVLASSAKVGELLGGQPGHRCASGERGAGDALPGTNVTSALVSTVSTVCPALVSTFDSDIE